MRHTSAQAPSVVDRVLDVFGAFTPDRPAMSLSELSRRAGLPLSTAHRIVGELARRGALERQEDGQYRVGLWLWEVASLSPRGMGLREAAMPFLEDLYEATHENVQLAVLDAPEVVYVERISGRNAVSIVSRVGGRLAAHATGVGLVLLANAPADVQEQVLAGPLKTYTPKTISSPEQLRRVLADVRRDGFVISDRQVELVSLSVAAPVYGPEDSVVAAISIVVPVQGADPRTLVPAVRAAARGISRNLGAPRAVRQPIF
ncbi:IclR family transcriptional regulator [Amycolatopsis acidiphila]|uniref:IclR family transcriptional regulator n=1 Tax=Amycolatopsis acidiphila TaxID=715473 RepID=A0A558AEK9_9PSEU|nr:IclR family transcriptional regulator [Amycolatopsis acidiphila]TVT22682.1 IclR family transcriptional regulator [Amycolatopsis acidiphila]UIJ59554.1 IclR family transcriptional regulator [Amycolatopsis acidiphila]GHG80586.1 IclR family transcriptional regulator [Amycolatopsis acidiphila]